MTPNLHEYVHDYEISADINEARSVLCDQYTSAAQRRRAVLTLIRYGNSNDTKAAADYMARMFDKVQAKAIRARWINNFSVTLAILAITFAVAVIANGLTGWAF
jgi:hypothetical protein